MSRPCVHTIDLRYLGQPGAIAAYVIESDNGPILIETGPASCIDALTAGLAAINYAPADIRHAFVTHIHLDHAAAAGWMAQHGTMIHVHEFGARHLVDPSRLIASATRIYGDQMQTLWGTIAPVPASQIVGVRDSDLFSFGNVTLKAVETPGHARHHHAYSMQTIDGLVGFTGDAAATYLVGTPFISLPTPPPEFDLDAWIRTLDRLDAESYTRIYPTHFGPVDDVPAHLTNVREQLLIHTGLVRNMVDEGLDEATIRVRYREWMHAEAERMGVPQDRWRFYVSDAVARMNVTGMLRYFAQTG